MEKIAIPALEHTESAKKEKQTEEREAEWNVDKYWQSIHAMLDEEIIAGWHPSKL